MVVEVEVRSFVSKDKYAELLEFFKHNTKLVKEDDQETFYFDCAQDLRIQKNNNYSKIWLKKGKMHDGCREEIEVRCGKEEFEKLEQLFLSLGMKVSIKWFRKRHEFAWDEVTVCLDFTKGYGYIIELEKMSTEERKNEELEKLKQKLVSLHIDITPKEVFDNQFQHYKENWRSLV